MGAPRKTEEQILRGRATGYPMFVHPVSGSLLFLLGALLLVAFGGAAFLLNTYEPPPSTQTGQSTLRPISPQAP